MAQMKAQHKTPEKELNRMETSNLLDAEFNTLVIRILKELSENFNSIKKDTETIKKNQTEMNNTLTEMKNTLQGINSGIDEATNQRRVLEDKEAENTKMEEQKEKRIQINEEPPAQLQVY